MCFSTIDGIEVEERRPRYPNEPHRKRLKLVRDRNSFRRSDEWTLVRPRTSDRLPPLPCQLPYQPYLPPPLTYGGHPPPPPPPPHPPFPPYRGPQGQGPEEFTPHPQNNFGNGIERIEEYHPPHQNHPQEIVPPRYVEIHPHHREPELRAHMPSNFQVNFGRSQSRSCSRRGHSQRGESRRGRSRTRSRSRGPQCGHRHNSVYSDDTITDSNIGSYSSGRRHIRRPRSFGADSYDSFDTPPPGRYPLSRWRRP